MIAEFMAGVVAFLLLCMFGYLGVLGEKERDLSMAFISADS